MDRPYPRSTGDVRLAQNGDHVQVDEGQGVTADDVAASTSILPQPHPLPSFIRLRLCTALVHSVVVASTRFAFE